VDGECYAEEEKSQSNAKVGSNVENGGRQLTKKGAVDGTALAGYQNEHSVEEGSGADRTQSGYAL
jgi:hypothetical protein